MVYYVFKMAPCNRWNTLHLHLEKFMYILKYKYIYNLLYSLKSLKNVLSVTSWKKLVLKHFVLHLKWQ